MNIVPSTLNFIYTYYCNFACSHCCFSCSPTCQVKLDIESMERLIDEAAMISSITTVSFSGGEMFCFFEELLPVIRRARLKGFSVVCNSNGYWGKPYESAERIVRKLKALNVQLLSLSYDCFHNEFVSQEAIENILQLSKKYNLNVNLKGVLLKNHDRIFQLASRFSSSITEVPVTESVCLRMGRAVDTIEQDCFLQEALYDMHCISLGRDIVVYPNGSVSPCCSPVMSELPYALKDIYTSSLAQILKQFNEDKILCNWMKYGIPHSKEKNFHPQTLCGLCREYLEKQ